MKLHGALSHMRRLLLMVTLLQLGIGLSWAAPPGSPWGADYFPNVPLVTQDGKTVHFYDDLIKDKVVAINFIYTACGDTCPMQTANLRQVYKLLADRMGRDIFFYSISIDPQHDTPGALKEYAERFKIGSDSGWSFLTGSKADTMLLRKSLGLFRDDAEADKLSEHNTSFLIGNERSGQWIKRSPFDEPKVLAWLLGRSMGHGKPNSTSAMTSYASAKEIPKLGRGEDLFRSRCDSCHSLGAEEGLGPGLQGVTERRDRAWLARWLKTPDQMLAENDPIASELFNRYQKLPMPNLRLSDSEVEALIAYMAGSPVR
ncbi:SCO family protein [Methylomonas sp. LL1]|uniref:SCO family protein n=1 Tax=Methylomonas sp. LL1 TaxID=2785785 RepID=UPI0018C3F71E|nr:SCO family protein [Methylomonas sp. LL1]QPK63375.1 SCO family protein [Methylomonas sp. LL1]